MERLYCDFVFIVDSELEWINDLNNAKENVGFPDFSSTEGKDMWESHFKWPSATPPEHYYSPSPKNRKSKKRYTFLANPKESFQAQLDNELIDILPFLKEQTNTETDYWKIKLKNWKNREYTPYEITEATIGYSLKNYLDAEANIKLLGCQLESFKQEKLFKLSRVQCKKEFQ